jgi:hypothetical protein
VFKFEENMQRLSTIQPRHVAGFIIVFSVLLSLAASLGVPIFEGPDEMEHYLYMRYLINHRAFPVVDEGVWKFTERHQPPLYYLLGAALTFWIPETGLSNLLQPNPFGGYQIEAVGHDNKNGVLHTSAREADFPYHGPVLAIHLLRLLSVGLNLGTLLAIYALASKVLGENNWLMVGALAFAAGNPVFIAQGGMVTNDALVVFLGHLIILLCLNAQNTSTPYRQFGGLGLLWGLAILAKMSALIFAVPIGLSLILAEWPRPRVARFLGRSVAIGLAVLLITGGWFLRNLLLYGEPTGMGQMLKALGETAPPKLNRAIGALPWNFSTYWATFGPDWIPSPRWVYWIFEVICVGALIGWLKQLIFPNRENKIQLPKVSLAIIGSACASGLLAVTMSASQFSTQGRHVFPFIGSIAIFLLIGFATLLPGKFSATKALSLVSGLLGLATWLIFQIFIGAFARPPVYKLADFSPARIQITVNRDFDHRFRLLGFTLSTETFHPGDNLQVTLYWEPLAVTAENYIEFVQVVSTSATRLGGRDTHPGLGNYPTSDWRPATVIADTISIPINPDAPVPGYYELWVGMTDPQTGEQLPMTDSSGQRVELPAVGRVRITGRDQPAFDTSPNVNVRFGEAIQLIACKNLAGNIQLEWNATGTPEADFNIFMHFWGIKDKLVSQTDYVPNADLFPTSAWRAGDHFVESIPVPTEARGKTTHLRLGLYSLASGERLTALNSDGQAIRDNAVDLPEECNP